MSNFLVEFISKSKNNKQKIATLKTINSKQYNFFRHLTSDILKGKLPVTKQEYKKLLPNKVFIRKLSKGDISNTTLAKNYSIISLLSKIYLKQNETSSKIGPTTNRRVGKNKRKKGSKTKHTNISHKYSEDSESMESEYYSEEEQEGRGKNTGNVSSEEGEEEEETEEECISGDDEEGEEKEEEEEYTSGEEDSKNHNSEKSN